MDDLAQRLQSALGEGYTVELTLGAGGFAVVYRVLDLGLKRSLAVKVLSPDLITSHSVLERFRREAETVAKLSHPNIVPLHFIGEKDGLLYLAMQCIEGGSLSERLAREKQLPVDEAVRVMIEVGSALAHAHKRGVVHRDIKPQNVLLDAETGRCLVTDFGIARTADSGSLTATGMVMGTPTYLAPEQVTGEPTDHRADIYALGVMGYEMLAGHPPFEGSNPTAVMMKRLAGPPEPITKVRREVPRAVEEVLAVALASEPAQRFQSAADLVRALSGASPTSGAQATTEIMRLRRTRARKLMIGVAIGVAAAVTGVVIVTKLRRPATPARGPVDAGMVLIPAGEHIIGSDAPDAAGPTPAKPAHTVKLAAFGIDPTEVTVGAYRKYVDSTGFPAPWSAPPADSMLPVTGVLWQEASGYCSWRHPDGGYLPSEEEWEAAARGSESRGFPWGKAFELAAANTAGARRTGPARVGSFPRGATASGIHDLLGNVWEWTASQPAPYPGSTTAPDPKVGSFRVIRGGAYDTPDTIATVWKRISYPLTTPRDQLQKTGFRCAMPVRKP